jgi:hypothetical protein
MTNEQVEITLDRATPCHISVKPDDRPALETHPRGWGFVDGGAS